MQFLAMRRLALTALFLGAAVLVAPTAYAEQTAHQTHHTSPAAKPVNIKWTSAKSAAIKPASGNYISVKEIPALSAPPAVKSRAHRADIKQIIGVQAYAVPEEIAAARDEQSLRPAHLVSMLDKYVSRTELPLTFALLDRTGADVNAVTWAAKKHWHTTRPYRLDHRIKLLVDPLPADNYGYPSGHSSTSLVWAQILTQLDPAAAARLQHQADRIAWHRVLAGVHTPHEVDGGKKLGAAIFAALMEKPAFQTDLTAAHAEYDAWRAATTPASRKNWKSFKSHVAE